jgi:hypothetical protein
VNTLIFIHIPKTAGQTFSSVLNRAYPGSAIYDLYGYGSAIPDAAARLRMMDEAQKAQLQLIRGHYEFGLHMALPQPATYITFLRDPVERVISLYYYLLRDPLHPLYDVLHTQRISLEAFASSDAMSHLTNVQVQYLSGLKQTYDPQSPDPALLPLAIQNLTQFCVVGIAEQFDRSLILMQRRFGWRHVHYRRRNVTPGSTRKDALPARVIEMIAERNSLDVALYHAGQELFEQSAREYGDELGWAVRRLQFVNLCYAFGRRVRASLPLK